MDQDWHSSKVFNKKVMDYHDKFAKQPYDDEARAKLELLKEEIRQQMDAQGLFKCMGFSYKGSTYEGVKIIKSDDDCPEFDLDFIVRGGEYLVASASENGWHELLVKQEKVHDLLILRKAEVNGKISPEKIMRLFHGSLAKCEFITKHNVKLRYHRPAVQLDVHYLNGDTLWFQVDLAPAFYLEGSHGAEAIQPNERFSDCYIAKLPKDETLCWDMWYRSYSSDEKRIMDKASGQRKVVLRTLKAMRGRSAQFAGLQSYLLKMCLIEVMDRYKANDDWTTDKTGKRLVDVMNCICICLEAGIIPCRFKDPTFLKLNEETRVNLRNLIWKLITNEKRMNDFLETN